MRQKQAEGKCFVRYRSTLNYEDEAENFSGKSLANLQLAQAKKEGASASGAKK